MTYKVVVLPIKSFAFLPFSSPSSLLELPIIIVKFISITVERNLIKKETDLKFENH